MHMCFVSHAKLQLVLHCGICQVRPTGGLGPWMRARPRKCLAHLSPHSLLTWTYE